MNYKLENLLFGLFEKLVIWGSVVLMVYSLYSMVTGNSKTGYRVDHQYTGSFISEYEFGNP